MGECAFGKICKPGLTSGTIAVTASVYSLVQFSPEGMVQHLIWMWEKVSCHRSKPHFELRMSPDLLNTLTEGP